MSTTGGRNGHTNTKQYKVGFTGTRQGMSDQQLDAFVRLVRANFMSEMSEFHHGDCVGSDAQAHEIVATMLRGRGEGYVYIHPPTESKYRALCNSQPRIILQPKPYLERDRDIVDACDILIATPKEQPPIPTGKGLRGGTWYTIRYARKVGKLHYIIYPEILGGWRNR